MPTIKPTNNNSSGNEDFSPTIRPNDVKPAGKPGTDQKTIRPGQLNNSDTSRTILPDRGKTILPGLSGGDDTRATILPGNGTTIKPNTTSGGDGSNWEATIAPDSATSTVSIDKKMYQPRSSYTISGEDYHVIRPLSLTSGEAQVFLVEDPKGNKRVLKLYYKGSIPVASILEKVKSASQANLLFKEYMHGAFEDRYYELLEYYDGDTLENVDVRQREDAIFPFIKSMAICIDFCHQLGFIHRDVKPSNFIFKDKDKTSLLLGDFGIAVEHDKNGECVADMARTKTFAAPEVYLNTGDSRAKFSIKSDFYSLGMIIIFLWMGRDQFTHFEKENELQLATMKAYGNFPIPANMPLRLFSLVKALIEPNPSNRAGFEEVGEWIEGKNPFIDLSQLPSKSQQKLFEIIIDGKRNLVAHSPKELANIMYTNADLAISYLYKGRITQWLEDNGRPEIAIEMERIKEDLYPRNTSAGLEAACYILDPSIPFVDICGNECKSSKEIADSILANSDKYLSQLSANLDSRIIVYLQTHGLASVVEEFKKEFSVSKRLGLLYLTYRIDASLPWCMIDTEGREGKLNTADEILNWVSVYAASDQSLTDVVSNAFMLWVGHRDMIAAAAIKPLMDHQGNIAYSEGVLYRLNPKVGLYYILDENSPKYVFTIEKLGRLINHCILSMANKTDADGTATSILAELYDIQQGNLPSIYHFLTSKGEEYGKWIDWIKYCLDLKSKDNTKKAGPYGYMIGLFKIAKGMAGEAFYKFKSGKVINHPSELSSVSGSDLQDAKSNPAHPLEAWISVFYQEYPTLDLSTKYTYERRTADYMAFLSEHDFGLPEIQRYNESKQIVESRAEKLRNTLSSIKKSRFIVAVFTIAPLCIAALLLVFLWRPDFGTLKIETLFYPLAVVFTICLCFIDGFAGKIIGEIIWGCVVSIIVSAVLSWLSGFASPLAPYVAAAMIGALVAYFYFKCLGVDLKEKMNDDLLDPDFEHMELEPLHEAFHPNANGFDSSIGDRTMAYQNELNSIKKAIWHRAFPVGIIAILGLMYFMNIASFKSYVDEKIQSYKIAPKPDFSDGLYGEWSGNMNNNPALVIFEKTGKRYLFKMVIKQNDSTWEFVGYYHTKTGVLESLKTNDSKDVSGKLELTEGRIIGMISFDDKENLIDVEYVPGTE